MISNQSHIIALVTPQLLNPSDPIDSPLFEKSAQLQKAFNCHVTMLHVTPPHSMERSIEETLAFKVLTRRVNAHFQTRFRTHTETAELTLKTLDTVIRKLSGDLLLRESPTENQVDSTTISLLESASYPVWYVCSVSDIKEISARISDNEDSLNDDMLTCALAHDLGNELGSEVGVVQSTPGPRTTTDLVITCVPTPQKRTDAQLTRLRKQAIRMLESTVNHDLLIHRGAEISQLPAAA